MINEQLLKATEYLQKKLYSKRANYNLQLEAREKISMFQREIFSERSSILQ